MLDARAQSIGTGVIVGVCVEDLLPAQAYAAELNLSLINPIKPEESYIVKVKRLHGLPTKYGAGKQIADPELASTLAIEGRTP